MKSAPQHGEQRQSQRQSPRLLAQLKSHERKGSGEIVDLSRGGAKLRVNEPWKIGTNVHLTIELFGHCTGEIIWSRDELVEIKFTTESLMLTLFLGGWCSFQPHPVRQLGTCARRLDRAASTPRMSGTKTHRSKPMSPIAQAVGGYPPSLIKDDDVGGVRFDSP